MDSRLVSAVVVALVIHAAPATAATYRTDNFVVTAPTAEAAKVTGDAAEYYRRELAIEWLGREMPNWYRPCRLSVTVGRMGAGGSTSFTFSDGDVFGWNMNVQGSMECILDSVIPHEVSHTVFACYFRQPLPRWADEGAATLVEHESERRRQTMLLNQVIQTSNRIPLRELLAMSEYPQDRQQVFTLYAEGYSLAEFLVQQKGAEGKQVYLQFLKDALEPGEGRGYDWSTAIKRHYGYDSVDALEQTWHRWIIDGSPPLGRPDDSMLADNSSRNNENAAASHEPRDVADNAGIQLASNETVRGQSPASSAPAPLPMINRALRSRPLGDQPRAPHPNVTAMTPDGTVSFANPNTSTSTATGPASFNDRSPSAPWQAQAQTSLPWTETR